MDIKIIRNGKRRGSRTESVFLSTTLNLVVLTTQTVGKKVIRQCVKTLVPV